MATPSGSVSVVQGKKTNSGSDRYMQGSGSVSKKWLTVGSVKLTVIPEKLYFADTGDLLVVGYHKTENEVLAWWNQTKKQGSNVGLLHLVFHTYIVLSVLIGATITWYVFKGEDISDFTKYGLYGVSALLVVIIYIFSYIDWRKRYRAQQLVNEQKSKLN